MKIQQRDIVELNFELPDGKFRPHPALVISNQSVLDTEEIFYVLLISSKFYNDEFTLWNWQCHADEAVVKKIVY